MTTSKQSAPPLSGFTFNENLGLYVTEYGLLNCPFSLSKDDLRKANHQCQELYHYQPWESGYNDLAYLAAGRLGLLSGYRESIEFTFPEALNLAKSLGVRLGTNREFTINNGNIENTFGRSDVVVLFNEVYDFTKDETNIDVYLGITSVLRKGEKYLFLNEHEKTITPIKVKGAQAKALREAGEGKHFYGGSGIVVYKDESAFLQSGKRVTEFDEHGIPTVLDNKEYGCIIQRGKEPHRHDRSSEFIGQRWVVDPKKGLVIMSKVNLDYWKPVGKSSYNSITCCLAPTTYLTDGIDYKFGRVNLFAVTGLENQVKECLKSLVQKDSEKERIA